MDRGARTKGSPDERVTGQGRPAIGQGGRCFVLGGLVRVARDLGGAIGFDDGINIAGFFILKGWAMGQAADTTHVRIRAIAATDALTDYLDGLRETLAGQARAARVFAIPTQGLDEEDPPTRPVADLAGEAAIHAAVRALLRTEYGDDQHPKATLRLPGILQVDRDMAGVAAEVNRLKAGLRAAMKALGYPGWLHWRMAIPAWRRLNRLQAYREWHWIATPMRRVSFTWAGHTTGGEQLRIAALIERLEEQYERYGLPGIEAEIDRLAGFDPDEVVVIRRPVAPTPIANIVFADGSRQAVKTALPFMTDRPMPEIGALRDFESARRNARRNDLATETRPLNEHLHVYRYVPAHRFRLRADPVPVRLRPVAGGIEARGKGGEPVVLPDPGPMTIERLAAAAHDTRGPIREHYALGGADAPVLVAANPAHAFFDAGEYGVWRIAQGDLTALEQLT